VTAPAAVNVEAGPRASTCPSCGSGETVLFHEVRQVPVHSVLLMKTREIAREFPRGDVELAYCKGCDFIYNQAFDPTVHSYGGEYEETQSFSPTFQAFHEQLAKRLIDRYSLERKQVIEVGCGKGDFLALLCRLGNCRGFGFDPAFVAERNPVAGGDVRFIADFYSEKYADYGADFVACKMTLEHISNTADFIGTIRRSIGERRETLVFIQVPETRRILENVAFEDIYYEHCSYFVAESLQALMERCGFEVVETSTEYDGQYLTCIAKPLPNVTLAAKETGGVLHAQVTEFRRRYQEMLRTWRARFAEMKSNNQKVILWGSGSKGVAFISALGLTDEISFVVDINPYRQGRFMAGSGHEIAGPEAVREYQPDVVIAMNGIYRAEIQSALNDMGVRAELMCL
jgi:SAM-dependent methyltransferase